MRPTQEEIASIFHMVRGTANERAGQSAGDPNLEDTGQSENMGGNIQEKAGQSEGGIEK